MAENSSNKQHTHQEDLYVCDELRGSGGTRPVDLSPCEKKKEKSIDEMYDKLVERGYTV